MREGEGEVNCEIRRRTIPTVHPTAYQSRWTWQVHFDFRVPAGMHRLADRSCANARRSAPVLLIRPSCISRTDINANPMLALPHSRPGSAPDELESRISRKLSTTHRQQPGCAPDAHGSARADKEPVHRGSVDVGILYTAAADVTLAHARFRVLLDRTFKLRKTN
jgi:hypothetical protein